MSIHIPIHPRWWRSLDDECRRFWSTLRYPYPGSRPGFGGGDYLNTATGERTGIRIDQNGELR